MSLVVRLTTDRADRYITGELHDLSFRKTAFGGFANITLSVNRPLITQPDEIALFGKVYVYDERDGSTVCEGYLEDPSRGAGSDGEVWQIAALGPWSHTHDISRPYVAVDRSYDRLIPSPGKNVLVNIGTETRNADGEFAYGIVADSGATMPIAVLGGASYPTIAEAGQKLARFSFDYVMGFASANNGFTVRVRTGLTGASDTPLDVLSTTTPTSTSKVVVTDWTNGRDVLELNLRRLNSTAVANEFVWINIQNLAIRAMLLNADGTEKTTGYTTDTVLASDVVKDLLGRRLPLFDGANATVTTTSYGIEQLVKPDGATAAEIFDDLALLDPAFLPAAWESDDATGLHRFTYTQWPTTVRYEADVLDGYESSGSAAELFNAVNVRWVDAGDRVRSTRRTQTVPELDAAGRTREASIDLGDEASTSANANRVGDEFLAEHRYPPNAGRLTIARPILDLERGMMVEPHEIEPGYLVRVGGILPRIDALNPTARDGVTVFKIAAMDYHTSAAAAALELDSYPQTVSRALARLAQHSPTVGARRRR
jgi:hypothetical protein